MPKDQLNFRASALTTHQLAKLMEWWGASKTEAITVAVDRAYREEEQKRKAADSPPTEE